MNPSMNDQPFENRRDEGAEQGGHGGIAVISRLSGGEATEQEWASFERIADDRPQLWRELAQAQRDQLALMDAVGDAARQAEHVDFARAAADAVAAEAPARPLRLNRLGAWTGWAVAAVVTLVAAAQLNQSRALMQTPIGGQTSQAGVLPSFDSPSDAFQFYLDKGRETGQVIGEVPTKVLVDSRANPAGVGYEVVFIRQVVERAVVPDLYQVRGENEAGQPTLTRFVRRPRSSM